MYYTTTDNGVERNGHSFLPPPTYSCDFETDCYKEFKVGAWNLANSLNYGDTPILDVRWEHLPIQELPFTTEGGKGEKLAFTTLGRINEVDHFKVTMSLRGQEAHLLLCDTEDVENANCYWFVLQGWSQKFTGLRRCNRGEIKGKYPDGECSARKEEKNHPRDLPLYMNRESWSHIIIERIDRNLFLKIYNGKEEETILHYSENDNEMFKLRYILGHRKDEELYCKIHANHYMRNIAISEEILPKWFYRVDNGFCISLLLNTCPGCSISLVFMDSSNNVINEILIRPTNGIWEHHKVVTPGFTNTGQIRLKIKTVLWKGYEPTGKEFWSFDNIRGCHSEEYRITQKDDRKFSECRLLNDEQKVRGDNVTEYVPDTSCSSEPSIGQSCILCSILQQQTSCIKLKICDNVKNSNKCYCSPGYTGRECNEECQEGTYGYLCGKNCGFCVSGRKCNVIDGSCNCNYFFEGSTCHTPKTGQYLRTAPKVVGSNTDSCEIQWDSRDYIGKTEPQYYLIQYLDSTLKYPIWSDYDAVRKVEEVGKATIGNLDPSKKYGIRILISGERDRIKELLSQDLPQTICITTCNGWKYDDINIKTTSQTATIGLTLLKDRCDIKSYKYRLKYRHGAEIINGNPVLIWPLYGLKPFTNYTIEFVSEAQTISKDFATLEGVPDQVRDIQIDEATTSYMKIRWKKPEDPNGVIEKYKIAYQRIQRISCESSYPEKLVEINTTETNIELHNLKTYSVYRVQIFAFNRLYSSVGSEKKLETQGLNYFKEDEELSQIMMTNETSEQAASIQFKNFKCDGLQGPLTVLIQYSCRSEWCLNTKEQSNRLLSFRETLNLRRLQPYCEYKCDVFICRNQTNCKIWKSGTFSTKVSAPNMLRDFSVIATGHKFISLRWLPPYPPTGRIKGYRITTVCTSCKVLGYKKTRDVPLQKCSIWPEYDCYLIDDNVFNDYKHSIEVEAINEGNTRYTRVAYVENILIQEKVPEKPYSLIVTWNLNNTMELFWNHPNRTNGILQSFHIEVSITGGVLFAITYPVKEERLTYNYVISQPVASAVELYIRIKTKNNKYESQYAEIRETSYPAKPQFANSEISIVNNTETTITLSLDLKEVEVSNIHVGQYAVILIDDYSPNIKDPNLAMLKRIIKSNIDVTEVQLRIVAILNLRKVSGNVINFTIGEGKEVTENAFLKVNIVNKPLQRARNYNVTITMMNEYKRKYRLTSYKLRTSTEGNPDMTLHPPTAKRGEEAEETSGGIAVFILFLLAVVILIIIGVFLKRKNIVFVIPKMSLGRILDSSNRILSSMKESDESIPLDNTATVVINHRPVMKVKPKCPFMKSTNPPNVPSDMYSKPVKLADFEKYVKTSIESGELERQHALFPRGQTQPWQYGSAKTNKPKNRYNNLIAYDHSRVILEKIAADENSDYINANYIHGYNIERAYIATQGPKSTTVTDFWRMVWQENVGYIVMVANIIEGGKEKVEQYWPNINEELTFRDIIVQYKSMELFANFEYRIFHVTKGSDTRKIEQLHFTTWPDHGVPLYAQSLVPFVRKLLEIPLSSTSPIVVHCSAGVGRTGTILLADISLRMAAKQGDVDLLNNLQKLREQRPNMVDNVEQYKLAHLVVLESTMGLQTSISCNEHMDEAVQRLITDKEYKIQMNYLVETEWQDQAMQNAAEYNEEFPNYPEKNRIEKIIPGNLGRIFLRRYPHNDESSTYINAVQVDGFRCPGRFFVTQQPLPNTVGDFWRFVTERKVNVIISLNEIDLREKTCCKFWPTADDPELQPVDFLLVKFGNATELEYYNIYSLDVWIKHENYKEKLHVEIVAFKRWPAKVVVPSCGEEFLSFYEEADAISRRSTNVVVTCFDGVTASGAYVALSFIIEKMKLEHECDVCLAVRTIRHNRKQFVVDERQFLFLYECAVKYINGFQSYANFQNQ